MSVVAKKTKISQKLITASQQLENIRKAFLLAIEKKSKNYLCFRSMSVTLYAQIFETAFFKIHIVLLLCTR